MAKSFNQIINTPLKPYYILQFNSYSSCFITTFSKKSVFSSDLQIMEAEKMETVTSTTTINESQAPPSATMASSCGWRKMTEEVKDRNFMDNFKIQFSGFIHTPMDQHMACFRTTIHKMREKFSLPKECENKPALEAQAAPEK